MPAPTGEQRAFVDHVVEGVPFLSFNEETGQFDVDDDKKELSRGEFDLLRKAIRRLRGNPQEPFFFRPLRVDEIRTAFPDRCLQHFAHQTLDLGIPAAETCWLERGLLSRCLGRLEPGTTFDEREKRRFLEELGSRRDQWIAAIVYRACTERPALADRLVVDEEGWILFQAPLTALPTGWSARSRRQLRRLARGLLRRRADEDVGELVRSVEDYVRGQKRAATLRPELLGYRDLRQLVRSIEQHGWDSRRAKEVGRSGVLGYSRSAHVHHVISGKHRIAALRYLLSQGRIDGGQLVEYPVITYPWGSWLRWRVHPAFDLCSLCRPDGQGRSTSPAGA